MNTIPSIFNEHQINRTVLGGKEKMVGKFNVSAIMLNTSGSHLRLQTLENLLSCGFDSIVWIEPTADNFNIEDISKKYPTVKFLIPLEKTTTGELINICVSEITSDYFIVLKDTLHIPPAFLQANLADFLTKQKNYCVVPRLVDEAGNAVSINVFPETVKGHFLMTKAQYVTEGLPTLSPQEFIGLYNREKFIQLGGFDYTIESPYWQNADLSVRSWLWGEKTTISTSLQISYNTEKPIDDVTKNYSYLRFYLKNILPVFKADHAIIKSSSFLNYKFHSHCGFFEAFSHFKTAQKWVDLNKYRFKMDIKSLIENWTMQNEKK